MSVRGSCKLIVGDIDPRIDCMVMCIFADIVVGGEFV